jgi:hypothetical protein
VSGADLVDGDWTVYSGQIYQTAIALPLTGYGEQITGNETLLANQVFVGGKMMIEARWPNLADSDDLLNRADFRPIAKDAWTAGPGGTAQYSGMRVSRRFPAAGPGAPSGTSAGSFPRPARSRPHRPGRSSFLPRLRRSFATPIT